MEILKEVVSIRELKHALCPEPWIQELLEKNGFSDFLKDGAVTGMDAGIMACDALIARTGSILISSRLASGRIYRCIRRSTSSLLLQSNWSMTSRTDSICCAKI